MSEDDEAVRNDVNYIRYLLQSGLTQDQIREIAREKAPTLEICFEEGECVVRSKALQRGKHIVLIS
ncbi:MAG: hypothetical protein OK422_00105 [Thaumarchaeota archaeon]|nr:hypothetical protein [Nitrososphaerota archaeon]